MPKQNPKPRSLRAQAFEESNYPTDVDGFRCVKVLVPDADEFMAQLAGVIALAGKRFNYQNKNVERAKKIAELWQAAYLKTNWETCCMCMNCEELRECLAPLLEELLAEITAGNNGIKVLPPDPYQVGDCGENSGNVYAGCVAAVQQVNDVIMQIYNRAEGELPDDLMEWAKVAISSFPGLGSLPFDELYGLANDYFENQREAYEDAYNNGDYKMLCACKLFCILDANGCEINHTIIGQWLKQCKYLIPGNVAGILFSKFGEATEPTFVQQIGEFLNTIRGGISLKQFFDDIITAFGVGAQGTDSGWENCACVEMGWEHIFDFTLSDWGWQQMAGGIGAGEQINGTGWSSTEGPIGQSIEVFTLFPTGSNLVNCEVEVHYVLLQAFTTFNVSMELGNLTYQDFPTAAGTYIEFGRLMSSDVMRVQINSSISGVNTPDGLHVVSKLIFRDLTGATLNPFRPA